MNKELVYIKDNIENTHYIYTNELDVDYDFSKCYEWLQSEFKKRYPETIVDLRYTITDKLCKIYCEEEITQKGWIWNSTDTKEKVLYELSKIPVCVSVEKIFVSVGTLTDPITTVSVDTLTEPEPVSQTANYGMQTDNIIVKNSYLDKVYRNPDNIFTYFDTNTSSDFTNEFSQWCTNELEPVISNISKLNLGNNGYAPNPFAPINKRNPFLPSIDEKEALTIELKKKLLEPNFGLRTVNYDF